MGNTQSPITQAPADQFATNLSAAMQDVDACKVAATLTESGAAYINTMVENGVSKSTQLALDAGCCGTTWVPSTTVSKGAICRVIDSSGEERSNPMPPPAIAEAVSKTSYDGDYVPALDKSGNVRTFVNTKGQSATVTVPGVSLEIFNATGTSLGVMDVPVLNPNTGLSTFVHYDVPEAVSIAEWVEEHTESSDWKLAGIVRTDVAADMSTGRNLIARIDNEQAAILGNTENAALEKVITALREKDTLANLAGVDKSELLSLSLGCDPQNAKCTFDASRHFINTASVKEIFATMSPSGNTADVQSIPFVVSDNDGQLLVRYRKYPHGTDQVNVI